MLKTTFLLLAAFAGTASALPHYYAILSGSGSGTATMILNQSQTGAAVDIFGNFGGVAPNFVVVGGGLVFKDPSFTAPDFDYNGTVYFSQFCCGSISVGSALSGTWTFDATSSSGGVSGIDYGFVGTPPADLPEPATFALLAAGLGAIAFARRRF